jgi:hypothetical protein
MDDALESSEGETAGDQPRVQGRCAWCGPVTFIPADLQVHVGASGEALFEFDCPRCGRLNVRALDRRDVVALLVVGIEPVSGRAPFELLERHAGPPIDWDDIIAFHEALSRRGDRWGETWPPAPQPEQERDAA